MRLELKNEIREKIFYELSTVEMMYDKFEM